MCLRYLSQNYKYKIFSINYLMEDILENLTHLTTGENIEGNCFTYHLKSKKAHELIPKQNNLAKFSTLCNYILEIGFNAGHSAAIFLENNKNLKLHCIDIGEHKYVNKCYDYLKEKYGDRVELTIMNSKDLIKLGSEYYKKFDGIHVDGGHQNNLYIFDLLSCFRFMADKALVIIDDTQDKLINRFADYCENSVLFTERNDFHQTLLYKHRIFEFNRLKVGVFSLVIGDSYKEKMKSGIDSKINYCKKWNHNYHADEDIFNNIRPIPWYKIKLLEKYIDTYDILMWIDGDTIIMNDEYSLDEYVFLLRKNKIMLIGNDVNGINSGVFMMNSRLGKDFLKEVWDMEEFINAKWWEQRAFIKLINNKYHKDVVIIPRENITIFNAYDKSVDDKYYFKNGDFIIHFAGFRNDNLINKINHYKNMINTKNNRHLFDEIVKYIAKII
jgi:hypothetical protein